MKIKIMILEFIKPKAKALDSTARRWRVFFRSFGIRITTFEGLPNFTCSEGGG
jgi:hypothetical protein